MPPIRIEVLNKNMADRVVPGPVKLPFIYPGTSVHLEDLSPENRGHHVIECYEDDSGGEIYFVPIELDERGIVPPTIAATLEKAPLNHGEKVTVELVNHIGEATLVAAHVENPEPLSDESIDFLMQRYKTQDEKKKIKKKK